IFLSAVVTAKQKANGNGVLRAENETRFSVQRQVTPGFAPELSVTLAARSAQQTGLTSEVEQRVTGYNL
ncbi:hypothetical protein OPU84_05590, partial [Klebsiella pneumoniae]|nr:hypothetical protein [Klebsiella pneumoniae]